MNIKFSLSGRGTIVLGTVEGTIITLSKQMEVNMFELFDTVMTAMTQFRNESIIVAAGVSLTHFSCLSFLWSIHS